MQSEYMRIGMMLKSPRYYTTNNDFIKVNDSEYLQLLVIDSN